MWMDYQAPCHDNALARSWLEPFFTCAATNSPRVSLKFHVPFENLFAGFWHFVCKEYLSCLCRVKAVSVEYELQLACMFVLNLFLRLFFFRNKTDTGWKVAFVCSRFADPLSRTSYFSTIFNSKHKICRLYLSQMPKQFFNIGTTIFTRLTRLLERDFSHKCQLWKLSSEKKGLEIKLPHVRRRVSNALQKHCSNYGNRLDHK